MNIDIQSKSISLPAMSREFIERRLNFALGRVGARLRRIRVRLSDVNGPRGGVDKRCQIQATLNGVGEIVIEDTQADLLKAISRAAERIGHNVMHRLERVRTRARSSFRRSVPIDPSPLEPR